MPNSNHDTALSLAIMVGDQETISALIDGGSNVTVLVQANRTLLSMAAQYREDASLIRYLVSKNVNVNATDTLGLTALMEAAASGHKDDLKALLIAGADATVKDKQGKTAADLAHERQHDDLAKILTKAELHGTYQH